MSKIKSTAIHKYVFAWHEVSVQDIAETIARECAQHQSTCSDLSADLGFDDEPGGFRLELNRHKTQAEDST